MYVTATQAGAVCWLQALMQDPRSGSVAEPKAPGLVSVSQSTRYFTPVGSLYVVPLSAGHCGPTSVGLEEGEADVVDESIDMVILVVLYPDGDAEVILADAEALEEVDCPDTKIPTMLPLVPAVAFCGRCLK